MSTWPFNPLKWDTLSHANEQMICPAGSDFKCNVSKKKNWDFEFIWTHLSSFLLLFHLIPARHHTGLREQSLNKTNLCKGNVSFKAIKKRLRMKKGNTRGYLLLTEKKTCSMFYISFINNLVTRWNINYTERICHYFTFTLAFHSLRTTDHFRCPSETE